MVVAAMALPALASAQTVDTSTCNIDFSTATQSQELACLSVLVNEVIALQNELSALQSVAPTSTVNTPSVEPAQTINQTSMAQEETGAGAQESISVSFATSSPNEGLVTVKNTLGVPVRIVNLDVDGTLLGFNIGTEYGEGFVYPGSFTDSQGKSFNVFTCSGLGSLGTANLGSSGNIDPCARRDANLAKNELQPGETMILRYTGKPTAVIYQAGSIVDLTDAGALLANDIDSAVRGLQFQDRTSQQIAHVVEDLDTLHAKLATRFGSATAGGAASDEGFAAYTMHEERVIAGIGGVESAAGDVELF